MALKYGPYIGRDQPNYYALASRAGSWLRQPVSLGCTCRTEANLTGEIEVEVSLLDVPRPCLAVLVTCTNHL